MCHGTYSTLVQIRTHVDTYIVQLKSQHTQSHQQGAEQAVAYRQDTTHIQQFLSRQAVAGMTQKLQHLCTYDTRALTG